MDTYVFPCVSWVACKPTNPADNIPFDYMTRIDYYGFLELSVHVLFLFGPI